VRRLLWRLQSQFFSCILAYVLLNQLIERRNARPEMYGEPNPEASGVREPMLTYPWGSIAGAGLGRNCKSGVAGLEPCCPSDEITSYGEDCRCLRRKIFGTCGYLSTQEVTCKALILRHITY